MKLLLLSCITFFLMVQSASIAQPSWLNSDLYPFESSYLDLPSGRMHYIDEGEGPVILFVHGTPSWSFLFREQVTALSQNYRCIALDHLGFGLSDKPIDNEGSPQEHSKNLAQFIQHLGLEQFTMVVHDFGGPIGLSYAIENPEKIQGLVIMNTWLWETKHDPQVQKVDRLLHGAAGRFLYLRMNFSARVLVKQAFHDRKKLTKEVHRHYIKPFQSKNERYGPWKIGWALLQSSDWYQDQWEKIGRLQQVPTVIVWGTKDPLVKQEYLNHWKEGLPEAEIMEVESGHFIAEEQPEAVTTAIQKVAPQLP